MHVAFDPASQRRVSAACLTEAGWVRGHFHVPALQSFADFLSHSGAFLPLTDVVLPHAEAARPFLAVQATDLRLVAPDPADAHLETMGAKGVTSPWSVHCLMADGILDGAIDFITNQRLSDYLKAVRGFLVVREAVWSGFPRDGRPAAAPRQFPVALVSIPRLVGIADAVIQRGHGHPGALSRGETSA